LIVVLEKNIKEDQLKNIIEHLEDSGFKIHQSSGEERTILGAIGVQPNFDIRKIKILEGVEEVYRITEPFKMASRSFKHKDTVIKVGDIEVGSNEVIVIAGPCSVESE
jgi:3-deoxy-7-phosphoheptulonate synthase